MGHIILDVVFLLVGFGLIVVCAKRGFLKSVIHFFKTILALTAAYLWGSALGGILRDRFILSPVRNFVYDKLNAAYTGATDGVDATALLNSLPEFLQTEEIQQKILSAEGSGEQFVSSAADSIATPVATVFSNILGYIGVFLIALIALWIAAILLNKIIEQVGILDRINTLLGAILGLFIAMILLLVVSSIVKFFWGAEPIYTDSLLVKLFGNSPLSEKIKFLNVATSWFEK